MFVVVDADLYGTTLVVSETGGPVMDPNPDLFDCNLSGFKFKYLDIRICHTNFLEKAYSSLVGLTYVGTVPICSIFCFGALQC